jgi:hypothetical protein
MATEVQGYFIPERRFTCSDRVCALSIVDLSVSQIVHGGTGLKAISMRVSADLELAPAEPELN